MIRVAYYYINTGQVTILMTGPDLTGFPDPQPEQACSLSLYEGGLPAYWDDDLHEAVAIPESPSLLYRWDWESKSYILDIALVKKNILTKLKAKRDSVEFGPFTYNGITYDGDLDAQRRLTGVISAAKSAMDAGFSFTKEYTTADNSTVVLTAEDFIGMEMAKIWQVDVAFQEYRVKLALVNAATTIEELNAITI